MNHGLTTCFAAVTFGAAAQATVLRVPSLYESIQAAFENVQNGDTVLVAPGIYAEALVSPAISFSLIGESAVDSLRPVVDPSSLADPTSLSCLIWNGITCHVENFVFRNGPEMFPRPFSDDGGVILHGYVAEVVNCLFDSANAGLFLSGYTELTLDHCDFRNCVGATVGGERTLFIASNCLFERHGILPDNGSQFVNCIFDRMSRFVMIPVGGLYLESCVFQNQNSPNWPTIDAGNVSPTVLNCIFRNNLVSRAVFFIQRNCTEDMLFENNLFENISCSSESGVAGLSWGCNQTGTPALVTLRNNTFVNSTSQGFAKSVGGSSYDVSTVFFDRNRFMNIEGDSPTIRLPNAHVILRDNIFINTTYALRTERLSDSRFNYWGDPSGPYNEINNPLGQGDEVSDSVWFWPWYGDTSLNSPTPVKLPDQFQVAVFPNPFNSTTRVALEAPSSFIASIELINILGQKVREIHYGPVLGHHEFLLDANSLPSGVYFVSIQDALKNSTLSTQKIALIR